MKFQECSSANSYELWDGSETDEQCPESIFSRKSRILNSVTDCKEEWHTFSNVASS